MKTPKSRGLSDFLAHDDPLFQEATAALRNDLSGVLAAAPPEDEPAAAESVCHENDFVKHAACPPMTRSLPDMPFSAPDQMLTVKMPCVGARGIVTKRYDDLRAPQESWPVVESSMLKQLLTWAKLNCFSRKSRHLASNIIDARWFLKNKWDRPAVDVLGSRGDRPEAAEAMMTIRACVLVSGAALRG